MANVLHVTGDSSSVAASTTNYFPNFTSRGLPQTPESRSAIDVRSAGTASNLFCYISANDRAQSTLRQRVDAGNGNELVTITGSTTGQFEDSSNTDSFDATEEVDIQIITGAGGSTFVIEGISQVFAPSSGTASYVGGGSGFGFTGTSDNFSSLIASSQGNTNETNYQSTIGVAATAQNGFMSVSSNTRSDQVDGRLRINGVSGNTILTYAAAATGDVEDTGNTDAVADGDELAWMYDQNGGSGSITFTVNKIEFSATDAFPFFATQIAGSSSTTINSGTTAYTFIGGSIRSNFDTTEADKQVKSNVAFTWSDLYGYVPTYSLSGGGHSLVVRSRINGGDGNLVITFTGTGQQSDASNTDTVADDDEINYSVVTGGTGGNAILTSISSLGTGAAAAGRSTKNTRATRLGMELGMGLWMN